MLLHSKKYAEFIQNKDYSPAKILFDYVLAIIGLVFLFPVLIVIATAVKIDSPGPVFYRARRTGLYGKYFYIYKFRSMVTGADRGPGTTSRNDPRVTRVGNLIRRYKLDELPQLINILKSEMSFVGPRPELPYYTDQYSVDEQIILMVKPGITDYSSMHFSNLNEVISDEDPDTCFEENILQDKNKLRIRYVLQRTFTGDIKLIFMTIILLFRR